ncbi:MAG: hypothetical protein JWM80_5563 [Cyanobacteria bacterium RYN_339]|nr:hypothetical protein [Cyanobacteria bacterium RYN_339]
MNLHPSITATELDAQVAAILRLIARRTRQHGVRQPSRELDQTGAEFLARCAVAAEAIDGALGCSLVRVAGAGKAVAAKGPALLVFRYVWQRHEPAHWPKVLVSRHAVPWADDEVHMYAEFPDPADPLLARLQAQPWVLCTDLNLDGRFTVRLDARALAALVEVTGLLAPAMPAPGPDAFAPALATTAGGGTDVVLLHETHPDCTALANAWLEEHGHERGLVSVTDGRLPPYWYITTGKALEAEVAVGAFGQLDVEALVSFLRRVPWTDDSDYVQLCYKRPQDPAFQLRQIWPLRQDRVTLADAGPAEAFDQAFGPVIDPVLVVRGADPDDTLPALEPLQRWLEAHGHTGAPQPLETLDYQALGLYDYGSNARAFVIPGSHAHGWCWALAAFLDTLPWSRSFRVILVSRSACGWRDHRWIWDDRPDRTETPTCLEMLRDQLWFGFNGAGARSPAEDDLRRFDAVCLRYLQERGYELLAEPVW